MKCRSISVKCRSSIGEVSVMYRPSIDDVSVGYRWSKAKKGLHIYQSTVGRYISQLSKKKNIIKKNYRPIVGRLLTDSRPMVG